MYCKVFQNTTKSSNLKKKNYEKFFLNCKYTMFKILKSTHEKQMSFIQIMWLHHQVSQIHYKYMYQCCEIQQ